VIETSLCIFVIDDDESVSRSLKDLLESAGFRAETFRSAEDFLGSDRIESPDVLILDVRLPGMTGIELQQQLKSSGSKLPVIFITAHENSRVRQTALENAAIAFLKKPFDDQALLDAIYLAMDKTSTG
jgi:FixJ family two-component response regulator